LFEGKKAVVDVSSQLEHRPVPPRKKVASTKRVKSKNTSSDTSRSTSFKDRYDQHRQDQNHAALSATTNLPRQHAPGKEPTDCDLRAGVVNLSFDEWGEANAGGIQIETFDSPSINRKVKLEWKRDAEAGDQAAAAPPGSLPEGGPGGNETASKENQPEPAEVPAKPVKKDNTMDLLASLRQIREDVSAMGRIQVTALLAPPSCILPYAAAPPPLSSFLPHRRACQRCLYSSGLLC